MKTNQRVAIDVLDMDPPRRYYSRIEGVEVDHLLLAYPMEASKPAALRAGTNLRVTLFNKSSVHAFTTAVLGQMNNRIRLLKVERPTSMETVQRRSFFRQPVVVQTLCRRDDDAIVPVDGLTRNLGGGGVCLRTYDIKGSRALIQGHPTDGPLWVEVMLPDEPLRVLCELRWWTINESDEWAEMGFEFVDLTEDQRERVIRFLFDRQREALKKGC